MGRGVAPTLGSLETQLCQLAAAAVRRARGRGRRARRDRGRVGRAVDQRGVSASGERRGPRARAAGHGRAGRIVVTAIVGVGNAAHKRNGHADRARRGQHALARNGHANGDRLRWGPATTHARGLRVSEPGADTDERHFPFNARRDTWLSARRHVVPHASPQQCELVDARHPRDTRGDRRRGCRGFGLGTGLGARDSLYSLCSDCAVNRLYYRRPARLARQPPNHRQRD